MPEDDRSDGVREKLDNPLVFIIVLTVAVSAGQMLGRWLGTKANAPGVRSFFGGNASTGPTF